MRRVDLSPLFRHSVGFERLGELFEAMLEKGGQESAYPPYNIVRTGEDRYRITLAVAGFTINDLEVIAERDLLTVRGKARGEDESVQYLHRGIARRAFEHRFQLTEHVEVTGARLANGLLDIELVREVPEAGRPKVIGIESAPRNGSGDHR